MINSPVKSKDERNVVTLIIELNWIHHSFMIEVKSLLHVLTCLNDCDLIEKGPFPFLLQTIHHLLGAPCFPVTAVYRLRRSFLAVNLRLLTVWDWALTFRCCGLIPLAPRASAVKISADLRRLCHTLRVPPACRTTCRHAGKERSSVITYTVKCGTLWVT